VLKSIIVYLCLFTPFALLSMFGCQIHHAAPIGYEPYMAVIPNALPDKLVVEFSPMFENHQFYTMMIDTSQGTYVDDQKSFVITKYFPAVAKEGSTTKVSTLIAVPMGRLFAYKMNTAVGLHSKGAIVCYDGFARKVLVPESLIRVGVKSLDVKISDDELLYFTTSFSCTTYYYGIKLSTRHFTMHSNPKQLRLKQGGAKAILNIINIEANHFADKVVNQMLNTVVMDEAGQELIQQIETIK